MRKWEKYSSGVRWPVKNIFATKAAYSQPVETEMAAVPALADMV
jgi:hypothetical protein